MLASVLRVSFSYKGGEGHSQWQQTKENINRKHSSGPRKYRALQNINNLLNGMRVENPAVRTHFRTATVSHHCPIMSAKHPAIFIIVRQVILQAKPQVSFLPKTGFGRKIEAGYLPRQKSLYAFQKRIIHYLMQTFNCLMLSCNWGNFSSVRFHPSMEVDERKHDPVVKALA